jgi:hypothetical protein
MRFFRRLLIFAMLPVYPAALAQTPVITLVANAEGGNPAIAPNTWVEIKGMNLSSAGDSRPWQGSDFVNNQLPTSLDGVSVTVNGKSAYIYYISPAQVNCSDSAGCDAGTGCGTGDEQRLRQCAVFFR